MDGERRGGVMSSRGETSQRKQWMGWAAQKQRGWGEKPEPTTPTLGGSPLLSPFPQVPLPLFSPIPPSTLCRRPDDNFQFSFWCPWGLLMTHGPTGPRVLPPIPRRAECCAARWPNRSDGRRPLCNILAVFVDETSRRPILLHPDFGPRLPCENQKHLSQPLMSESVSLPEDGGKE